MLPPNKPQPRVIRGTLPPLVPVQATRQDATAPGSLYRTNPSSPAATSDERGSFTGGAVRLLRKALPINVAMFAQDLTGNKVPLTEADLTPEEMAVLRRGAREAVQYQPTAEPKEFGYTNYGRDGMALPGVIGQGLGYMLRTPEGRMATTIGGATLHGGAAEARLTDRFEFDNHFDKGGNPLQGEGEAWKDYTPYEKVRFLAERFGSNQSGTGIPVNINLGNLKRPMAGEFPAPPLRVIKGTLPKKK